ncbi:hypothetical protein PR048_013851 [Dryococelus australis]|uniref:Uncharacterized protein n=1 Tax=Dryococelus australis TaxID=614101 RepID=A0ABQ9HUW8_9NEOP|nr:hypothetical protein PR048_013851 [Dryococelus australis]
MEQRRNEGAGETGDHRENPTIRGIVRHDSHMRNSESDPAGNRTLWEASSLATTPPRPRHPCDSEPNWGEQFAHLCCSSMLYVAISTVMGATVAELLARLPPTKTNRVQSPAGSPDFRKWESCRTMPLVGGFSRVSPVYPAPSSQRRSLFTSIILVGIQDLSVKSRPNLFTHSTVN